MRPQIVTTPQRIPADGPALIDTSGFAPSQFVSEAEFLHLRSHPAMPRAVAKFGAWLTEHYTTSGLLNLLLSDRGRMVLGFYVLYLDVLPLPGTQERGATLGAVQSLCRRTGLCSAGRAASVVALMRFSGYLTQTLDPYDRRRRILIPLPRLVGAYHRNWVQQFEAMGLVYPEAAAVPAWLEQDSFRTGFLRALGTSFLGGFRVIEHAPVLAPVGEINAGIMVLTELALGQIAGNRQPSEVVPLSVSAMSRRFRISRAHVRKILQIAEAAALIIYRREMDGIVVQPAMSEALLQLYGVLFILFGRSATTARLEQMTM